MTKKTAQQRAHDVVGLWNIYLGVCLKPGQLNLLEDHIAQAISAREVDLQAEVLAGLKAAFLRGRIVGMASVFYPVNDKTRIVVVPVGLWEFCLLPGPAGEVIKLGRHLMNGTEAVMGYSLTFNTLAVSQLPGVLPLVEDETVERLFFSQGL